MSLRRVEWAGRVFRDRQGKVERANTNVFFEDGREETISFRYRANSRSHSWLQISGRSQSAITQRQVDLLQPIRPNRGKPIDSKYHTDNSEGLAVTHFFLVIYIDCVIYRPIQKYLGSAPLPSRPQSMPAQRPPSSNASTAYEQMPQMAPQRNGGRFTNLDLELAASDRRTATIASSILH